MVRVIEVIASGSPNTVDASWKDMPCFLRLASDLSGSHSNFIRYFIIISNIILWSNAGHEGRGAQRQKTKKKDGYPRVPLDAFVGLFVVLRF